MNQKSNDELKNLYEIVKLHPETLINSYTQKSKDDKKKFYFKQIEEPEKKVEKIANGPIF